MQFSILREHLLKALKSISGVVERRPAQSPVLSNVRLLVNNDGVLVSTATDKEVELTYSIPVETVEVAGSILVSFKKLNDICRALPDKVMLKVKVTDAGRISIVAGKSRFSLATMTAEKFPKIEPSAEAEKITLSRKVLLELLERTSFAMAEQDVRYFLNGMLLEWGKDNIKAVAADGHRLVVYQVPIETTVAATQRIIVPRKGVLEILRSLHEAPEQVCLAVCSKHVRLECGSLVLVSTLFEGAFPDYQQVVPKGGDKVVVGRREALKEAFQRAAALLNERVRGVSLKLGAGRVKIFANNAEKDEAEEELDVAYTGEELTIGFNVSYLVDFLSVATAEKIKMTFLDANSSVLLEEEGAEGKGVYIIMPMRV